MIVSEYYLSAQTTFTVWTSAEDFHSREKLFCQTECRRNTPHHPG